MDPDISIRFRYIVCSIKNKLVDAAGKALRGTVLEEYEETKSQQLKFEIFMHAPPQKGECTLVVRVRALHATSRTKVR